MSVVMTTAAWHAECVQSVQQCIEPLYLHMSVCLSVPDVLSVLSVSLPIGVCLFALPNYPLGTIKIDSTELCGL